MLAVALVVWAGVSAPAAQVKPDFSAKLPAQVGEWKRPAKPVLYDRKTLYDYIDDGAELYLAFDFVATTGTAPNHLDLRPFSPIGYSDTIAFSL